MTETPVATTYVVIDVVGVDADAKLDSLSQAIGDAGKTIPAEKLHFSVCHSSPSFSASEAIALAEELDEKMKPTTLPRNLNSIFKCNKKVFFNVDGRHQGSYNLSLLQHLFFFLLTLDQIFSPWCGARRHHQPTTPIDQYVFLHLLVV